MIRKSQWDTVDNKNTVPRVVETLIDAGMPAGRPAGRLTLMAEDGEVAGLAGAAERAGAAG